MRYGTFIDLSQNEFRNAVLQNLSAAPASAKGGQIWTLTTSGSPYYYNSVLGQSRPLDAGQLTDGSIQIAAIGAFQPTVLGYRLDQFAAPTNPVGFNSQRVTAIGAATQATDAVQYGQMQTAITAAIAGQTSIKNPARAYASANITLSGTQTIDGVSVAVGDRVLVGGQTTASQNGLYVVASGAWALATDGNTASEWLEGTEILVAEGTGYGGAIFSQATASPTLTNLTFVQRNKINAYLADGSTITLTGFTFSAKLAAGGGLVSSGGLAVDTTVVVRKFAFSLAGNGSATSFTVTHNLGTTAINPAFQDNAGNGIIVDWVATSANVMTVTLYVGGAALPAGTTYSGVVMG